MALLRRFFHRKPPEGFLEISERVYVFDCCFYPNLLEGNDYQVDIGRIVDQLHEHFPDTSFMVFNFGDGDNQTKITNVLSKSGMTVIDYICEHQNCPILALETIHNCLKLGECWLSIGQRNVLLMHCQNCVLPVLAFMLAAFLIYNKHYAVEQKTLDMIYKQAPHELLQMLSPMNPLPSQLRYLQYVSRMNTRSQWGPLDMVLMLDSVILRVVPDMDGQVGCRPMFRTYGLDQTTKMRFSTPEKSKDVRYFKQADSKHVNIDINHQVRGDVVLECVTLDGNLEDEEMMFRVMFNTAFIRSNTLILNRDEIDILWSFTDQFPKDFRVEVLFSEMDSPSSPGIQQEGPSIVSESSKSEAFEDDAISSPPAMLSEPMLTPTKSSLDLDNVMKKIESSGPQVSVQRPAQSKIISSPISRSSLSNSPSLQVSPVALSRFRGACASSALGITALLHDHAEFSEKEVSSPLSSESCISASAPCLMKPLQSTNSFVSPSPEQHLPEKHSINSESGSRASSPPPPPSSQPTPLSSQPPPPPTLQSNPPPPPPPPPPPLQSNPSPPPPPPPPPPPLRSNLPPLPPSLRSNPSPPPPPPQLRSNPPAPPLPPLRSNTPPAPPPPPLRSNPHPPPPLPLISNPPPPPPPPPFLSNPSPPPPPTPLRSNPPPPPPSPSLQNHPPPPSRQSSQSNPPPPPEPPSSLSNPPPPPPAPTIQPRSYETRMSGVGQNLPPPPPPPPTPFSTSSSSLSSNHTNLTITSVDPSSSIMKEAGCSITNLSSISASPPPPPPFGTAPPLTPSPVDSSPTICQEKSSLENPNLPATPPQSSDSVSVSTSGRSASPPPCPPSTIQKEEAPARICKVVPPPPAPLLNGLSKAGNTSLQLHSSVSTPMGIRGKLHPRTSARIQAHPKKTSLKPYHWLKLTRAMQGSLWAEAQKPEEASKAPELDLSELESLFSANIPNSDHGVAKANRRRSKFKPDKVHLIELRRAYNCEIMLTKVKVPLSDLMNSVLTLDDSALDIDQVDNLIKFCPTKEEMELLKNYNGDKENLGKCEQFFLELMKVPRVESKLRVFSFKIQFFFQVSDLRNSLNVVNSASKEVRSSVKLRRIMQTILTLGNALNHGTARGSAVGFRLDSLLKLTETRARNNKLTLMHYLCKVLAEKLPEVLDFRKDLVSLEAASKIQLKYLAEEMQAIHKGLEKVVQELAASENDGPVSQYFFKTLKGFFDSAEAEVRSLASLYSGVGRNADALALYFGEDPARCPFEQVISTLLNFVRMFQRAHGENCKQLEFEKKKAQKEAENGKAKSNAPTKDMQCDG